MYYIHTKGRVFLEETPDGIMMTLDDNVFRVHKVTSDIDDDEETTFCCLVNYDVVSNLLEAGCDFSYSMAF